MPRAAHCALYGAAASPDVLIRREREESAARDGKRREDAGGTAARTGGARRRERQKDWHPMGARSFFVMIVILEPDQPRASGPAGRLLLCSISYSSRSRPSGRYATLIPPFAGAIYASGGMTPRRNPICMPRPRSPERRLSTPGTGM